MPKVLKISKENNAFQYAETLKRNRQKRNKSGEFFIEGTKSIELAIQNNWDITALYYDKKRKLSNWAKDILKKSKAEKHFETSSNLYKKLSDKEEPSELIALIKIPEDNLSRINISDKLLIVVFDRPSSPGNLGTIIRSCELMKVDGLIITGHAVDLYDSQTIRSSIGTVFSLPVIRSSTEALLLWIKEAEKKVGKIQIIGSSANVEKKVSNQDFAKPTVLIIGNETHGLSSTYRKLSDEMVKIPIYGSASSLNVACATSIILYEINKQRSK